MIAPLVIAALAACGGAETPPAKPAPPSVSIADLELRGVRAVDELASIAKRVDHPQRAAAVLALGRVGDDRASAVLIAIAGDGDARARRDAAVALGIAAQLSAKTEVVAAGLIERWKVEPEAEVRAALAIALGRSKHASALAPLVAGLGETSRSVVGASALALGLLGRGEVALDDAARRRLAELAASDAHRYEAAYALAREHRPPVDPVVLRVLEALAANKDPEIRAMALTGLARRRRGRILFAEALADPDWRVAVAAVSGLADLKSDAATGDLARWLSAADLGAVSPMVLREALRVLLDRAELGAARSAARAVITKVRRAPPSLDRAQIECLAEAVKARRLRDLTALRRCGDKAPRWWRKSLEAEVVSRRDVPAGARLLELAALYADDDPRVRVAALTGITRLGTDVKVRPQVVDAVTRSLSDKSVAVAGTAVDAVNGLSLTDAESGPLYAALIERGTAELEGDGELGLGVINAIAAGRIAAGESLCRAAHGHRNRMLRRAGRTCLETLTGSDPGPGTPAAPATPPHRPTATGTLRWTVETSRGRLSIELDADRAPWHVAAIAAMTRAGFYDGLLFHRVVPGFVTQGGDPTGTGWGGPGFVLPPEPTDTPYDRGVVGIADAGPGTGGSQWFITHARAAHLEGRYTAIGRVTGGLEVIDKLAVGDTIVKATIAASGDPRGR